jgi:proteasome accessory factor C
MSRVSANTRLRRVLAMVPWLVARPDGAPIDEVCRRFGVNRQQLLADLDVLWMVGVHPYTPAELIEVDVDDDRVSIRLADWFRQPLRLTPDQALALVATGQSLAAVPGADPEGPLARGIAKVAAVLGVEPDAVEVELGEVAADTLELLQLAIDQGRRLHIDYYTYGRDEQTSREIDPIRVFADEGQWYLQAHCHSSQDERVFRIDRITDASLLDEPGAQHRSDPASGVYRPDVDVPRVVLHLGPSARWVPEQYPVESMDVADDGSSTVTLAVSAPAWLERLLLRLGPDVRGVDGPEELISLGRRGAERILERYRS